MYLLENTPESHRLASCTISIQLSRVYYLGSLQAATEHIWHG